MATPQKTRGIKHHPPLSDSDRGGLVLDTFGICLWREQGRRAAPREKSVGRCARKRGAEERGRYWQPAREKAADGDTVRRQVHSGVLLKF